MDQANWKISLSSSFFQPYLSHNWNFPVSINCKNIWIKPALIQCHIPTIAQIGFATLTPFTHHFLPSSKYYALVNTLRPCCVFLSIWYFFFNSILFTTILWWFFFSDLRYIHAFMQHILS